MKHLYYGGFALLAGLVLVGAPPAKAQTEQSNASSEFASSSVSESAYPEYFRGTCKTPEAWQRDFNEINIPSGQVTIDCAVATDGHLTSCKVIAQNPKSQAASKAVAEAFLCYAHVDPASIPGGVQAGARKKFTYKW